MSTWSLVGNTPPGVGKTAFAALIATSQKKHPHGRGEDTNILLKSTVINPYIAILTK